MSKQKIKLNQTLNQPYPIQSPLDRRNPLAVDNFTVQ